MFSGIMSQFGSCGALVWVVGVCCVGASGCERSETTAAPSATTSAAAKAAPHDEASEIVSVARRDYPFVWKCIQAKSTWMVATGVKDHAALKRSAADAATACEASAKSFQPATAKGPCARLSELTWRAFVSGRAQFQRAWSTWFEKAGLETPMQSKTLGEVFEDRSIFDSEPKDFSFGGAAGAVPAGLNRCVDSLVLCDGRACGGELGFVTHLGLRGSEAVPGVITSKASGAKL